MLCCVEARSVPPLCCFATTLDSRGVLAQFMGGNLTKPQIDAAIYDPAFYFADDKLENLVLSLFKLPEFAEAGKAAKQVIDQNVGGAVGAGFGG